MIQRGILIPIPHFSAALANKNYLVDRTVNMAAARTSPRLVNRISHYDKATFTFRGCYDG